MPDQVSRRSFVTGVLACGTVSAAATYFAEGGRGVPDPPAATTITLRLASGADESGARQHLTELWNGTHPKIQVTADNISTGSRDERDRMADNIRAGEVDIVNLDLIYIREFARDKLIVPIPLPNPGAYLDTLVQVGRHPDGGDNVWAVPFNADVGMLFTRRRGTGPEIPLSLLDVIHQPVTDGSAQLVGQLANGGGPVSDEPFVVNVLEHALAVDRDILRKDDGFPSLDVNRWRTALAPLRDAISEGRVVRESTEVDSRRTFADRQVAEKARYMRNWPLHYRLLQQEEDADVMAGRIQVDALQPAGILGGQSLALASGSRHPEEAIQVIQFLTSDSAQRLLATYGLAPALKAAYSADRNDMPAPPVIPHFTRIREAVDNAYPRPVVAKYRDFAEAVVRHVRPFLDPDRNIDLSPRFIEDMRKTLV